jgi:hypothetical protein
MAQSPSPRCDAHPVVFGDRDPDTATDAAFGNTASRLNLSAATSNRWTPDYKVCGSVVNTLGSKWKREARSKSRIHTPHDWN